jgi:hypothetical protein
VEFWFRAPVLAEPDAGLVPLQAPLAAHDEALVEAQVRVEAEPAVTDAGEALRVIVGDGVGVGADP